MIAALLDTYWTHEHYEEQQVEAHQDRRKPEHRGDYAWREPRAAREVGEAEPRDRADRVRRFPSKLARQLHLLASVEGVSIASIVTGAVGRAVAKRLPNALAGIARADEIAKGE